VLREASEKSDKAQSIVQISESINKTGISLLDNVAKSIFGCLFQMIFRHLSLLAAKQLLVLLDVSLDLSELVKELVMHENFQVLLMIVRLIGSLELLLWLTRIDTLEDAYSSKVLERELELANCFRSGEVL
jgi:hypothetical protein